MQLTDIRTRVESVVAIPVTPFDDRDGVDEKSYGELITRLVDGGIEVITSNGNTGEFYRRRRRRSAAWRSPSRTPGTRWSWRGSGWAPRPPSGPPSTRGTRAPGW
jgi:hypothetical protein